MAVYFNGRQLVSPTVETVVFDQAMVNQNAPAQNVLAIIGVSDGGQPKTPLVLGSPGQALEVLKGGELLDAVEKAFAPSVDTGGPIQIIAMRVNPATQSSLNLLNGSAATVISLVSTDYGLRTNNIRVKIQAGTTVGKKVSTQFGDRSYVADDLARTALVISYDGAGAVATVDVDSDALTLTVDAVTTVIDFATYPTVQDVAARINLVADFTATMGANAPDTHTANGLDHLAAGNVKAGDVTVTAHLQAIVDWLNSVGEGFVTATRAADVGTVPANIDWTFLSGGVDGVVANQDWSDCFQVLQTVDVQWLVPLSSNATIWAMADAHCQFMSLSGKRERRAFVGAGTGVDTLTAVANATALGSDRVSYLYPGVYDFNRAGALTLYPGYMHAAIMGGAFAGLPPGETMTHKRLRIQGLETELASPTDTDLLISNGVLATFKDARGAYRVARAITTWLTDTKYNKVEISTGAALDYTVRRVREGLEFFLGRKGSPFTLAEAQSLTGSILAELAAPAPTGLAILAGDPGFRNISASINGDVLRVQFECSPVIPLNFVLVSVFAVPYRGATN